jgi:hypothetical protein
MPSHYLKCDGCGAIIDRWPVKMSKGDGTFGRYQSAPLIEYAESIGWKRTDDLDFCPKCTPVNPPPD